MIDPDDFKEKRRVVRFSNQYLLRFSLSGAEEDDEKITGMVHDISTTGAAFWLHQSLKAGDILDIEIEIFNENRTTSDHKIKMLWSNPIEVKAEVLRSERADAGLHLIVVTYKEIEEEDLALLQKSLLDVPVE